MDGQIYTGNALISEGTRSGGGGGSWWQSRSDTLYQKSIEQACLMEVGQRFTQANQTLFLQAPLLKDFGEIGVNQLAFKAVLAGVYVPLPGCALLMIKLLQTLWQPADLPDIQLSGVEFNRGWHKA